MAGQAAPLTSSVSPLRQFKTFPKTDWIRLAEIAFLTLLFAAGFLARLWPVWKVHFWDEAVYLQNAEVICCGKNNYSELSSRPPLLSLLYAIVFLLWHNVYAASLFAAAMNASGPLLLYRASKTLHSRTAAVISSMLLAFSPFFVTWGNTLLTDNPALTLTLVAFCLLLKAVAADGAVWFALAGLVTGLSGLMRFTALVTLLIFPMYFFRKGEPLKRLGWYGLGLALAIGPYFFWSQSSYGSFLATLRLALINVGGSEEPWAFYLRRFGEVFPWITVAGLAMWFVAWLQDSFVTWGRDAEEFVIRIKKRVKAPTLGSDALIWAWALLLFLYFSTVTHKELRYIIPLAAPLFLLAGRGLAVLAKGRTLQTRAVGCGILVLALGYSFAPNRERFRMPFVAQYVSEEKEVADYLDQHANPAGVLYVNFNYPVFGYYTSLKVNLVRAQDMGFYDVFPKNMPKDGYFIIYKQVQKEPTVAWADGDPHFRRFKEFPSVIVYEYRQAGFQ